MDYPETILLWRLKLINFYKIKFNKGINSYKSNPFAFIAILFCAVIKNINIILTKTF